MNIPDHIYESLDTFELAIVRNNATFFLPRDGSGSSEVKIITNSTRTSVIGNFLVALCVPLSSVFSAVQVSMSISDKTKI